MRKFLFLFVAILLFGLVSASDFTPQGNINLRDVYNITGAPYVNATLYYGNGSQLVDVNVSSVDHNSLAGLQGGSSAEYYHLNQTWYRRVIDYAFSWIIGLDANNNANSLLLNNGTNVGYNQTILNQSIEVIDTATNVTMKNYVDGRDVVYNNSMKSYVDSVNDSQVTWVDTFFVRFTELVNQVGNWTLDKPNYYVKSDVDINITSANTSQTAYTDSQDIVFNDSMKDYTDGTFIPLSEEANLDVNSSTWWAGLTGWVSGWFENDGNELSFNETKLNETGDMRYVNIDGDTMTGNLDMNQNNITNISHLISDHIQVNFYINMTDGNITDANTIFADFLGSEAERIITANIKDITGVDSLQFNITFEDGCEEGRVTWNIEDGTLQYGMPGGNVCLQIGQENLRRAKANETLTNGDVVYPCGAIAGRKIVCKADYDSIYTSGVIGVTTEDITINQFGFINAFGLVRDIDTTGEFNSCSEGLPAWLSSNGQFTCIPPSGNKLRTVVGVIDKVHGTEGILDVFIQLVPRLQGLSQVDTSSLTTEDVVVHNSTSQTWVNKQRYDFTGLNVTANEFILGNIKLRNLSKNEFIDGDVMGIIMTNPPNTELPHLYIQSGGPGQFSGMVRSWGIVDEEVGFLNNTNRTDCQAYFDFIGEELKIDCNTTTTGADFFVSDDSQFVDEVWMTDTDDEWHFMTRELGLLDENRKDTVISGLNLSLIGNNLTITEKQGNTIVVNLHENTEILDKTVDSILLTEGTNTTPIINYVYYENGGSTVLAKSNTQQDDVGDIAIALLGSGYDYGSIGGSANGYEFNRKSYFDSWYRGEVYQSGFDIEVTSTEINISTGTMWLLMEGKTTTENHSTNGLAIEIHSDGTFHQHINDLDGFDVYSTGEAISNNKYFNLVCGAVNSIEGEGLMYCQVQDIPSTEHTKLIDAETDTQYVNYFPSNSFIKKLYVPVVQVVMKRTGGVNTIQTLTTYSGNYIDLRGRNLGTGGSPPTPGITSLSQLTIDTNYEGTGYNTTADNFFGNLIGTWNGSSDYYTSTETDSQITSANTSMKNYVDGQDIIFNDSIKSYVDSVNSSLASWTDSLFVRFTEIVGQVGNWTLDKVNYYTSAQTDTAIETANTSMGNYVDSQDIVFNNSVVSWSDSKFVVNSGGDSLSGQYDFNGGWTSDGLSIVDGDIYAQTGYFYNITGLDVDTLRINGSLLPMTGYDNQFDIGNSSLRWKDINIGGEVSSDGTGDNYFIGKIGIGTSSPGSTGVAKLEVSGTNSNVAGPHMQFTTTSDIYPLMQITPWTHDNVGIRFDSYYDSGEKSSDVGSNFMLHKFADTFQINYDSGVAVGDVITWNKGIVMDTSGNVGIGTDSPGAPLEVAGSIWAKGSGNPALELRSTNGGTPYIDFSNDSSTDYDMRIMLNGDDSLGIVGGNVGIGTSSPSANLHVISDTSPNDVFTLNASSGQAQQITRETSGNDLYWRLLDTAGNTDVQIHVAGNSFFNGGNVGIGTSSPAKKLDLKLGAIDDSLRIERSASNGRSQISLANESSSEFWRFGMTAGGVTDFAFFDGTSNKLVMERGGNSYFNSGNVGIGTATPNQKLTIEGTMSLKEQASANADTAGYGQIWVKTATPNLLYFTNDAGTDVLIGGTSAVTSLIAGAGIDVSGATGDVTVSFEGGASPAGDLGGTWASPSVNDDSHNHIYSNIDATTSANWNTLVSDNTGTGAWVFGTSPTFTTGITVPANSISDEELNEGDTFEWTNTHSFAAAGTFNDDLLFYDEIKPDGLLCSDGQILKKTGADNWDCAEDAGTTYTAGGGIALATTTFSVAGGTCLTQDTSGLSVTANCIDDAQIADNGIDSSSLAADSVSDSELDGGFSWTLDSDLNIDSNTLVISYDDNRIGIGTATPSARLDVEVSSGGAATIGSSSNTATGNYAVALGDGATASGSHAMAIGASTIASGIASTAMGGSTIALGDFSTAMGNTANASGLRSTAMGFGTTASGDESTAMGHNTIASDDASTAMGYYTNASGVQSTSMGSFTVASGYASTAMGREIEAGGAYSFAVALNDQNGANCNLASKMCVMGGEVLIGQLTDSGAYALQVNGEICETSAGTTACSSDERLKENILPLENGLDLIMNLKPKTFNFIGSSENIAGFIAQDINKSNTDWVVEHDSDEYITFNDKGFMQTGIVKAIQELFGWNSEQDEKIEKLETENNLMKISLCKLGETQWC